MSLLPVMQHLQRLKIRIAGVACNLKSTQPFKQRNDRENIVKILPGHFVVKAATQQHEVNFETLAHCKLIHRAARSKQAHRNFLDKEMDAVLKNFLLFQL